MINLSTFKRLSDYLNILLSARNRFPSDATFTVELSPDDGGSVGLSVELSCGASRGFRVSLDDADAIDLDDPIGMVLDDIKEHNAECPNRSVDIGEVKFDLRRSES